MKKNLQIGKKIALALMLLVTASVTNAQTRTATTDGPWNSTATWGGQSVPTAAMDVVINNNVDVTLPSGANGVCNSITFANAAGSINVSAGFSITVSNAITVQNVNANNVAATLSGAGTISCASIQVGGTLTNPTTDNRSSTLTTTIAVLNISGNLSINAEDNGNVEHSAFFALNSGTVTVNGSILIDSDSDGSATANASFRMDGGAGTGTIILPGATPFSVTGTGTETINLGGNGDVATVNYSGAAQTVLNTVSYRNLVLSGSGVKTTTGVTVGLKLSIQGTATVGNPITYSTAILEYKGSAAQTTSNNEFLSGNADLEEVIIDNPAGVTLSSARTLDGVLTLTNGFITTTTTNLLTLSAAGSATSANNSYVNGPIAKISAALTAFTLPVGSAARGTRAVTVTPASNTNTTYRAQFNDANPRSITNGGNLGSLVQISGCEYWTVDRTAGTANAAVTLSWLSTGNNCGISTWGYVTDLTQLVVARHNGTSWVSEGRAATTGTAAGGGTIRSNTVTSFSPFTLASTAAGVNPLPVTFSDVKAFEKGAAVQIDWTNSTESDMSAYLIERSADGINFSTIGQTAPRSNQFDKVSYTYFDAAPLTGTNFYRIKAIELSGKNVYSKALRVDIGRNPKGISLYPNPVRGSEITIGFSALKGQYNLNVVNTAGQVVYRQALNHTGGTVAQTVSLPASLKAGVYNVLISGDNYKETKTFVIQ